MDFSRAACLLIASSGSDTSMSLRFNLFPQLDPTRSRPAHNQYVPEEPDRTRYGPACLARTAATTRSAADSGASCSQTRTTFHPSSARCVSVSRSRSTFRASFAVHHSALFLGSVLCSGHACQKHPSTNTATCCRGKRRSARLRGSPGSAASTRYRRPRACRTRRSAHSAAVSRVR